LSVTFLHFLAIFLSIAALFVMSFMASIFVNLDSDLYGVIAEMYGNPIAWLTMILILCLPLILEMMWRSLKRDLRPTLTDILQERIRLRQEKSREIVKKRMPKVLEADKDDEPDGNSPGIIRRSSQTVGDDILTHEDETKFRGRKPHRQKGGVKPLEEGLARPQSYADGLLSKDETLKRSVIRAMLRFRNLTGSTFDSAAQAQYQHHDVMSTGIVETKEKKHETKDELEVIEDEDEFEDVDESEHGDKRASKAAKKAKKEKGSNGDGQKPKDKEDS